MIKLFQLLSSRQIGLWTTVQRAFKASFNYVCPLLLGQGVCTLIRALVTCSCKWRSKIQAVTTCKWTIKSIQLWTSLSLKRSNRPNSWAIYTCLKTLIRTTIKGV